MSFPTLLELLDFSESYQTLKSTDVYQVSKLPAPLAFHTLRFLIEVDMWRRGEVWGMAAGQ